MARTVRIKIYKFDELAKEIKDQLIEKRITEMLEYEHEDHYANWPAYKTACDKADELRTPWFTGAYVWDNCKKEILEYLRDNEYFDNGKFYITHQ